MAEPEYLRRMKARLQPGTPQPPAEAPVHQGGAPDVPMKAPQPAFLERMKRRAAEAQLGAVPQAVTQEQIASQTHRPMAPGQTPQAVPGTDPAKMSAPQEVPATLLDRTSRLQLERDMALASRIGFEALGTKGGSAALKALAERSGLRVFANRAVQAGGRAIGAGAGSLAAEGLDPTDDPWQTAKTAALYSGFADGLAGAYYGAKDRLLGAPLTPGARSTRRVLGGRDLPSSGRLSTSRGIDTAENVEENALFGGRAEMRNVRSAGRARQLVYDYVDRFLGKAQKQDVDRLVLDVLGQSDDAFRTTAEQLYKKVDEIAGVPVPTDGLIKIRNQLVKEYSRGPRDEGVKKLIDGIDRTLGVPEDIAGLDKGVILDPNQPRARFDGARVPGSSGREIPLNQNAEMAVDVPWTTDPRTGDLVPGNAVMHTDKTGSTVRGWVSGPADARAEISFAEAQRIRSAALRAARGSADNFPGQLEGASKLISGQLDRDIEAVGTALAGSQLEAYEYFRLANQFWKDGAEAFNSQIMRAVSKARPDDVFKMVMQPESPEQIRMFRQLTLGGVGFGDDTAKGLRQSWERTLRNPAASPLAKEIAQQRLGDLEAGEQAWKTFKGQLMANILQGSDESYGLATEAARGTRTLVASSALDRMRALGEPMLRELFPKQSERRIFERFLRAAEMPQQGTGTSTGRLAVQLQQAGAVTAAATGLGLSIYTGSPEAAVTGLGTGAVILLGPAAVGRLIESDRFVNALFKARSTRLGTEESRRAWIQVATIASREGGKIIRSDGSVVDPRQETPAQRRFRGTADAAGYGR